MAGIPVFVRNNYEIHEWRHASAILKSDFPEEFADICDVLTRFRLKKSYISVGGGRKSKVSEWIDSELSKKGWIEKNFQTSISVDQKIMESPTHAIDYFRESKVAAEPVAHCWFLE